MYLLKLSLGRHFVNQFKEYFNAAVMFNYLSHKLNAQKTKILLDLLFSMI